MTDGLPLATETVSGMLETGDELLRTLIFVRSCTLRWEGEKVKADIQPPPEILN